MRKELTPHEFDFADHETLHSRDRLNLPLVPNNNGDEVMHSREQ